MAKENGKNQGGGGANVIPMNTNCCVEKCNKKQERMNFCAEHFIWFKEGLVNKAGKRPSDFDKKYQAFLAKQKSAA